CQTTAAAVELGVAVALAAVDHGRMLGVDGGCARQERQRRKGLEVGGALVEGLAIGVGGHETKKLQAETVKVPCRRAQTSGPTGRHTTPIRRAPGGAIDLELCSTKSNQVNSFAHPRKPVENCDADRALGAMAWVSLRQIDRRNGRARNGGSS